jgi:hypothetical protein
VHAGAQNRVGLDRSGALWYPGRQDEHNDNDPAIYLLNRLPL